jgi:hypothetical protein
MRETLGIASNPAPANRHNESDADVHALEQVVAKIVDEGTRDYLEEAVRCLRADARRACIVFAWTGAIRVIHDQLLKAGNAALSAAIQKHDARARPVSTMDHFAYIKDKTTLLAAQELGIFDKSEKDTLEENLGLRNRCGHPGKYQPREKKVASFIEDLVTIVF